MESLKGKIVLITGSSIGIGRETAFLFAKEGAKVIITYYQDKKPAQLVAEKCRELGSPGVMTLKLNIADLSNIKEVIKRTASEMGPIDVLVNNAGCITWEHLENQSHKKIDQQINVNLAGLIKMTKEALPHTKETVINISSGSGKTGYENLTVYCATKFGVRGFTQALAQETAVKIFSINPPLTKTRMSGFQGIPARDVAEVILDTAKRSHLIESGVDIDVPKHWP